MFCKNCGNEIDPNAAICVKCGFAKGTGNSFCGNCGGAVDANANVCLQCGYAIDNTPVVDPSQQKSKLAAGLLGIFLGSLGVHNFYLGYTGKAVAQLLICVLGSCIAIGPVVSSVWGLIEGIMILCGKIDKDAKNIPLGE